MPVIPSNAILRGYTYRMGPEHLKTQGLFFSFLKSLHITITYKAPTLTGVTCVVMLKSLKLSERNGLFCSCKWFRRVTEAFTRGIRWAPGDSKNEALPPESQARSLSAGACCLPFMQRRWGSRQARTWIHHLWTCGWYCTWTMKILAFYFLFFIKYNSLKGVNWIRELAILFMSA